MDAEFNLMFIGINPVACLDELNNGNISASFNKLGKI